MNSNWYNGTTRVSEFRFIRFVRDLAALRSFYEEIFDWPIVDQWDEGVMYDTGGVILELIQNLAADKPNGSSYISLSILDVSSLFQLLENKVTIISPLTQNSWGDTSFQMSDPDGFFITFFTPTLKSPEEKIRCIAGYLPEMYTKDTLEKLL